MCFTHCLSVQAPPLTNTIRHSWVFALLQHIGIRDDWETLSSFVLSKYICCIEYWKAAKQSPKSAFNCYKVNRCLVRYSRHATITNRPTNRALNKPAWPGPNWPKMPILGVIFWGSPLFLAVFGHSHIIGATTLNFGPISTKHGGTVRAIKKMTQKDNSWWGGSSKKFLSPF